MGRRRVRNLSGMGDIRGGNGRSEYVGRGGRPDMVAVRLDMMELESQRRVGSIAGLDATADLLC